MSSKLTNTRTDRFQSPPYQEELTFIIPSAELVEELFANLLPMSSHDYDVYEMMTLTVSALAIRNEAPARIVELAGQYQRLAKIGKASEYNNDVDILSRSWLTFSTKLFKLYDVMNIWDERGCAHFYFKRFLGNDMVVSNKPRLDPREVPPYVYHR